MCAGGSYNANNFNITNATTTQFYENNGTSASGCDSTMVLHLIVHDLNTTNLNGSICLGESYTQNGFNVVPTTAGDTTVTRVLETQYHCDSMVVLHLTVNPVYNLTDTVVTCQSETPYHYEAENVDLNVSTPGTRTILYEHQTAATCDSNLTLTLIVNPVYHQTVALTTCQSETPYLYADENAELDVAEPGIHTYVYEHQTVAGCDSIITLNLTVNETKATSVEGNICLGESYTENGFNVTPTMVGDTQLVRTLQTALHCDSVVTLNLTVNPVYAPKDTIVTCQSETPYHYESENVDLDVSADGVQNFVYEHQTAAGCDSNLTLTLIVNPVYHTTIPLSVCQSEMPYVYQNGDIDTTFDVSVPRQETMDYHFQTVSGCDSIITVNLTVNPSYSIDTTVSVCDVELPYIWNNDPQYSYSESGDYQIVYELATGCDSVVNLHLDVHQSFETDTIIQICQEALPYMFDENHSFSSQGSYTVELTSPFGCDSIYHVQLVVTPAITHTVTLDICDSDLPYPYGNETLTQAGQYELETPRADGCNEVTYLTLNVHPTYAHETTLTICESELPYRVGDTTFTEAGVKTVHFRAAYSCDSAVTVTLVVNPEYAIADADTVCQSETPYHYAAENDNIDISVAGERTYTYPHTTVAGCDSTVTFTLTVRPAYTGTRSVTLCANSDLLPYSFGDMLLTTSGVYTYNFHTADGCDSIETLTFTVKPVFDTTITASICQGDSYVENGFNITPDSVGTHTYTQNYTSSLDCDSTVNLVLTVNPSYVFYENETVHSTTLPFEWHGQSFMESTSAFDSLTTEAGCDSLFYLTLTVTEYNIVNENPITICQGEPLSWRGYEISESGIYSDTVATENTIYRVNVTVNPSYHLTDTMEVCDNQLPYPWHGRIFTGDTVMVVNYQTAAYCDSSYTLVFMVHPTYNMHEDMSVCENVLPIEWHGKTISEPGNYTDSLQTAFGCDSIYTLTVNVTYVTIQEDSMTVCGVDETYAWHGMTLSETGLYSDTLRNANGCDSIVYTMNFVKGVPFYSADTITLREEMIPYDWGGYQISEAGTYYNSYLTADGCDSVYSLTVFTNEYQFIESTPISLCSGDSTIWRNKPITEGGVYTDTVEFSGSYIIYSVTVTMNNAYYYNDTVTICQNALPYPWQGRSLTAGGYYENPLQTVNGCDSVYTLQLIVNDVFTDLEEATICSDEDPYEWRGHLYFETGVYTDSLTSSLGCDSVYTLNLTVNPAYHQDDTVSICEGSTYEWRGRTLQTSGFYTDEVPNDYGCQDVYTLMLTVNPSSSDTVYATICLGETYAENGFNVTPEYANTVYYEQIRLDNQYGCDSLINLVLTVNPSYLYETEASTCEGTPYEWRGEVYTEEGTYYDRYETVTGCDSVYVLYLTVNPSYDIYVVDTAVVNEAYDNYGLQTTPTELGVFEYTITNYTETGCDSIVHITLHVESVGVNEYVKPQVKIYPNPAETYVNIEGTDMARVLLYDMHGRLLQVQDAETPEFTRFFFETASTGTYILKIQNIDGAVVSKKIMIKHF